MNVENENGRVSFFSGGNIRDVYWIWSTLTRRGRRVFCFRHRESARQRIFASEGIVRIIVDFFCSHRSLDSCDGMVIGKFGVGIQRPPSLARF